VLIQKLDAKLPVVLGLVDHISISKRESDENGKRIAVDPLTTPVLALEPGGAC
jgi:hypothetical protein